MRLEIGEVVVYKFLSIISLTFSCWYIIKYYEKIKSGKTYLLTAFWMPTCCMGTFYAFDPRGSHLIANGVSVWNASFWVYFSLYRWGDVGAFVPLTSLLVQFVFFVALFSGA